MRIIFAGLLLMLTQCSSAKPQMEGNENKREVERLKQTYSGYELYLCGNDSGHTNQSVSLSLWKFQEKPLCNSTEDSTIRILFWSMLSKYRVFVLTKRNSEFILSQKNFEWRQTEQNREEREIVQSGKIISEVEAKKLFGEVENINGVIDRNPLCVDGTSWLIETIINKKYKYLKFDCIHPPEVTRLGANIKTLLDMPFELN